MTFDKGLSSNRFKTTGRGAKGLLTSSGLAFFLAISGVTVTAPQVVVAQSYAFQRIEIEGTQRIEAATILSYLGIAQGETVSAAQLNDGYQRLVGSGLFEDVQIHNQCRVG